MKMIERDGRAFRREYIPLIFAVLFLIGLIIALVYAIVYKPEKKLINELYSMETEELPVDITNIACNNDISEQIKNDANNVKVRYEMLDHYYFGKTTELETDLNGDGVLGEIDEYGYALKVVLSGITDNVYLKLENDIDYNEQTYKKEDTDNGTVSFDQTENAYIRTYTVKVYSNNPDCGNILYREFKFVLPRVNDMATSVTCLSYPDIESCKPFVFDNDKQAFLNNYHNEINKINEEQKNNSTKENKTGIILLIILLVLTMIVISVGVVVIVFKRRR